MTGIVEWAESKYGFFVDRHWTGDQWALESGPIRLADYHAALLAHCFTPDAKGRLPYDVIAWCEPAKSGKSAIAGLMAEYAGLHLDGDVVLASNKQNQAASLMFGSLADSVRLNPHLRLTPGRYEVTFRNGNTVRAIPSNSRSESGARFSLALFDELWAYFYRDSERLWSEFKTDPTRLNSGKVSLGYAGYLESELWLEQLQAGLRGEPVPELAHIVNDDGEPACWRNGRRFTFWSHVCRQPWQTEEWIESQRATLRPAEFQRMILTLFVESIGDFIDAWAWEMLIDADHRPLAPGSSEPVYVGLDIATKPGGDDCALVGVYSDGGLVKVAFHQVWKGGPERKHDLKLSEAVEPYIKHLAQDYKIAGVHFDPFQALQLAENLRAAGIRCIEVPQTHATRGPKDTALYEMIRNGELVLYDHPDLRGAAAYANAQELGSGLLFIRKAGRGRIDLLIALSNCASEARHRLRRRRVFVKVPSEAQPEPVMPAIFNVFQPGVRPGVYSPYPHTLQGPGRVKGPVSPDRPGLEGGDEN